MGAIPLKLKLCLRSISIRFVAQAQREHLVSLFNCTGRLAKEGGKYGLKGLVADPEEEDMEDLTKLKVCILSF